MFRLNININLNSKIMSYLNTSYVSVKSTQKDLKILNKKNLNTSYVSVKLIAANLPQNI